MDPRRTLLKSDLKKRTKNWKLVGCIKISEKEKFQAVFANVRYDRNIKLFTDTTFHFNLGTRRSLVSSATENGLEAGGYRLRMEAIGMKTTSRMI